MSYVQSNQIKVFPSTRRTVDRHDSRLMTERALVGIINQLVDKDAFIVTPKDEVDTSRPFEFNIHGYYFYVPQLSYITNLFASDTTNSYIYASILLDTGNEFTELLGQDDTMGSSDSNAISYYKGVDFSISSSDTGPSGTNIYSLRILERNTSGSSLNWTCPENSFYKFEGNSLDFNIDGGIIT